MNRWLKDNGDDFSDFTPEELAIIRKALQNLNYSILESDNEHDLRVMTSLLLELKNTEESK